MHTVYMNIYKDTETDTYTTVYMHDTYMTLYVHVYVHLDNMHIETYIAER